MSSIRLGLGSYTWGWAVSAGVLSATQIIDFAAEHAIGVVQFCDNLPPDTFAGDRPDELRRHADNCGIGIEFGTAGSQPEHLRKMIRIAQRLGSGILRVVLDTRGDEPSADVVVQRIQQILPSLRAAGITLAIENHDRFSCDSLRRIVDQCEDDHVGICLDTVNSMGVPEVPQRVVEALGPYVVNLHLKDFIIRRVPSKQGFMIEGCPSGDGMLDVPWLLSEIQKSRRGTGSPMSAIIEVWSSPLETIERTIQRESEWVLRSIDNLRRLGMK